MTNENTQSSLIGRTDILNADVRDINELTSDWIIIYRDEKVKI